MAAVGTYPVKYFIYNMQNAPVVSNVFGNLVSMLDACLINGFNQLSVASLTRSGTTVTGTITGGHQYLTGQILWIDGAGQSEYNGELYVTSVTATTFTFEVTGSPVTPATGTITVKVAPIGGWVIAFTGTNKRVYRSTDVLSNKPFLRVDDSQDPVYTAGYAKYAKVTMAEEMTGIDTFTANKGRAPFQPSGNQTLNEVGYGTGAGAVNGWHKWYYDKAEDTAADTNTSGAGARAWVLVGDDRGFYLSLGRSPISVGNYGRAGYCFTDIQSYKTGDMYNTVMAASEYAIAYNGSGPTYPLNGNLWEWTNDFTGKVMMKNYTQVGDYIRVGFFGLNLTNAQHASGAAAYGTFPNGPDFSLILWPMWVREEAGAHIRGVMPGAYHTPQLSPYPDLMIIDNVAGFPGRRFLSVAGNNSTTRTSPRTFYDITGPWVR